MQAVNSWRNCQWEQPRTSEQRPEKEPLIVYTLDAANVHLHVHEIARAIINATPAVTTPMRGDRNLLFGAPGRSGQDPRRDLGGGQGNCPTSASRVLSCHIPESGRSIRHTGHGCQEERVASRIGCGGLRAHGGTAPGARPRPSRGQLTRRQCDPLQGRRQRVPRPAGCGCGWARVPGGSGSSR